MAFLIFPLSFILQSLTVVFYASTVMLSALVKFLLPFAPFNQYANRVLDWCISHYGVTAIYWVNLFNNVEWDYKVEGEPSKNSWYLLTSNHISYLDIMVILNWAHGRIPPPKFFIKKELLWMPFVGQAAWALDMPFMRRYSKEQIAKNPELQIKDIETTRKHCEKYKNKPTTVINFIEGTRFSAKKQMRKGSDFKHLLPPKAGGIAFTLASMGDLFSHTIDVTLQYPENPGHVMMDTLTGKLKKIVIHIKLLPITEEMIGDYYGDPEFKAQFQERLNQAWRDKDKEISKLLERKD